MAKYRNIYVNCSNVRYRPENTSTIQMHNILTEIGNNVVAHSMVNNLNILDKMFLILRYNDKILNSFYIF